MGTRPVSLGNIDFNFRLKGLQFLLSGCKNWITQQTSEIENEIKGTGTKDVEF